MDNNEEWDDYPPIKGMIFENDKGQYCNIENNYHTTQFYTNGPYISIRNNKISSISQYKFKTFNSNKESYCVATNHSSGHITLCSKNKEMMEKYLKVLPTNKLIKRYDRW
jgi:hypothetical protein